MGPVGFDRGLAEVQSFDDLVVAQLRLPHDRLSPRTEPMSQERSMSSVSREREWQTPLGGAPTRSRAPASSARMAPSSLAAARTRITRSRRISRYGASAPSLPTSANRMCGEMVPRTSCAVANPLPRQ